MRWMLLLVACGTEPSPTPNDGLQTQGVSVEGRWSGAINGKPVKLDLNERFELTVNQERFAGTYQFNGETLVLNTTAFWYADIAADAKLCIQTLCAPAQAALPAALTDVLLLDVGPMLPNHPKTEVVLSR